MNTLNLDRELETFLTWLPRLLADGFRGQFLVVQGSVVYGPYPTFEEALTAAYAVLGEDALEGFLVREITEEKPIVCPREALSTVSRENEQLRQENAQLKYDLANAQRLLRSALGGGW